MSEDSPLRSERLLLRPWRRSDRVPFARLNADERVIEFFPAPLARSESDALADRIEAHFERHGFGFWALEIPGHAEFAGFVGLSTPSFDAEFTPCVEIGWRLDPACWGRGYATEASRIALAYGFEILELDEIVSFTVPQNLKSIAVMERIGLKPHPLGRFDHPRLPPGHPLRRHRLYHIIRDGYQPASVTRWPVKSS